MAYLLTLMIIAGLGMMAYQRTSIAVTTIGIGFLLFLLSTLGTATWVLLSLLWLVYGLGAAFFNLAVLRKKASYAILQLYRRLQPKMSQTEKEAIEAGTVDWDAELFSGQPDWDKLLTYPAPTLSEEEQAFIAGPVEALCRQLNDWEITHEQGDLPTEIWDFLKKEGFFGLIIPKNYGGKAFSAYAHSQILVKIAGVSITAATSVSVPNSLGPAELLLHYGTEEQKNHYLPRLARGEEMPCFALTGPQAGSDASAMADTGIVTRGMFEGKEIIGIRLNWDKRYITLAPIATVLGLAFKLQDPDHLLGEDIERGITCALIPTDMPGVKIGRRHFPLNIPFQNGPTQGKDVFIPLDWIIGGAEMIGHGWRMLMECLSVGRAVSLPSISLGGAKLGLASSGAYAHLRQQFKLPIGEFEGIQAVLGEMAGLVYIMDAAESMTTALIDAGQKPAVPSAIIKYHCTEMGRRVANLAMDLHGGKGICLGPKNYLGRGYEGVPISITVEGANILTRNMIIFGQGALRCHPFALKEMQAANLSPESEALDAFDKAIWAHIGFSLSQWIRSLWQGLTAGWFLPKVPIITHRYYQKFERMSTAFALLADTSMLSIGGELKRCEMISARLGDILSYLYLGSATLKRFADQGRIYDDLPLVEWSCDYLLHQIQVQIEGLLNNHPHPILAKTLGRVIFPWGKGFKAPRDKTIKQLAKLVQKPSSARSRLLEGTYLSEDEIHPIGRLESLLKRSYDLAAPLKVVAEAKKKGIFKSSTWALIVEKCLETKLLSEDISEALLKYDQDLQTIIAVDDFEPTAFTRVMALIDTEGRMVSNLNSKNQS